jgi:peroxiredoxin
MATALMAAGTYNVLYGAFVVLFPNAVFHWAGMTPPNYPWLWQCVGMIVGVYGVGYAIAASNPYRHWPIVLVGMMGKVFGPIGFAGNLLAGSLPIAFGWQILTNDLVWWIPFALILLGAHRAHTHSLRVVAPDVSRMALRSKTQFGTSLEELSRISPILLVFLRHAGCTFCREALADLAEQRSEIESSGTRIVIVHMGQPEQGEELTTRYGLSDIHRVSDPSQSLYRAFGLTRGALWQLFGLPVWIRGFQAGVFRRHGVGQLIGDGFQMPGVFVVFHGEILAAFRHRLASDRPHYVSVVRELTGDPVSA